MAKRGKKSGDESAAKFSRLTRLWTEVGVEEWEKLLTEKKPQARFSISGGSIKGCCPFHDEDTPSFWVTPRQGVAYCFGCKVLFTNPVSLVARLCGVKMGEALLIIRRQFGIRGSISDKLCDRVSEYERHQELKRKIVDLCCEQLLAAIKLWPDETALSDAGLYWAKATVDYLVGRKIGEPRPNETTGPRQPGADPWGVWQAICRGQLVGALPPLASAQVALGTDSEEFKFYAEYTKKYTGDGNRYIGWLVLPYHDSPGSVSRIKLREPSTGDKKLIVTIEEDEYKEETENFLGYYGLHYYRLFLMPKSPGDLLVHTACVVEGEFDALSSIAQQIRRGGAPDFISLALSGGGASSVEGLHPLGVSRVRVIGDNDEAGEKFTKLVLERSRGAPLSLQVFRWPDDEETCEVKDPDEAVKVRGYGWWQKLVCDDTRYLSLPDWCVEQARSEISRSAVTDVRMSGEIAARWGKFVYDKQEIERYVAEVAKACGISADVLREDLAPDGRGEDAYIDRVAAVIRLRFDIVGRASAENRKSVLRLWDKESRSQQDVVLNDETNAETFFSAYYGGVDRMLERHVGPLPATNDGEAELPHAIKLRNCRHYVCTALKRLSEGLPNLDDYETKGQGIHVVTESSRSSIAGPPRPDVYIVNGRDVFHLQYDEDDQMTSERLTGPTHGKTVFMGDAKQWAADLTLERIRSHVDVVKLFGDIRRMIDLGWKWKYQEVDATLLAAHVLCLSVMNLFRRQTMVFLTAERSSGKSRFLEGLIGGTGFPKINVLEHSLVLNDYTEAAVAGHAGSTLCLCLDEFELDVKEPRRSAAVKSVLLLMRDMISEAPVRRRRGNQHGGFREVFLRFPLMLAAINPPQGAADISRMITVEPVHSPTRERTEDVLLRDVGEPEIIRTRRDLTVGLLRHIPVIMRLQDEVEREFSGDASLLKIIPSRNLEALYPVLTMLKFLGMEAMRLGLPEDTVPDYHKFVRDFAATRQTTFKTEATNTTGDELFNTILNTPFYGVNDDTRIGNRLTIGRLLGNLNELTQINKTVTGVYFDPKMEWLVVNWTEARQGVLRDTEYRSHDAHYLRKLSERSPQYVQSSEAARTEVLDRLATIMGPAQNPNMITIFSVRHILDKVRQSNTAALHGISIVPQEVVSQADLDAAQAFAKQFNISVAQAAAHLAAIKAEQATKQSTDVVPPVETGPDGKSMA